MTGPAPFRLLQLSDCHLFSRSRALCGINTDRSFKAVLSEVKRDSVKPDAILVTGDVSQDGSAESYRRFARYFRFFKKPVYVLPGNHDSPSAMRRVLRGGQVQAVRKARLGSWKLFLLDSNRPGRNDGQLRTSELARLRRALRRETASPVLVTLHHNPFPLGSPWLDTMTLKNGPAFMGLIRNHKNVRLLAFGHVHQAYEKRFGRFLSVGAPSTCLQFKPKSVKMKIDTRPPGYRWLFLFTNGKVETVVKRVKNYRLKPDYKATGY